MIKDKLLQKELQAQILKDRNVQRAMDAEMEKHFLKEKKAMLAEFDAHPVTQGLRSHSSAGLVPRGTLFGFLGFAEGDRPTEELRQFLNKFITFKFSSNSKKRAERVYAVKIPTKDEIYDATPLPWADGRSWVKGIEHGISGMGKYMDIKSPQSRSGEGIQSKNDTGGRFRNTSYISSILNNFKKKLQSSGITF
tara:strand:- start:43 stop:624 length:582 start_codon:yes stop_codon:yes gene_type:complete